MIPWVAFRPNEQHPDWRADLNEHNLYYFVASGPSQLMRGLDSPMLELAHERQFAIAQLGTRSVGFEAEHSAQVQDALHLLDTRFTTHRLEDVCRPNSPHAEDLVDFRTQHHRFSPLPSLDISHLPHCEPPAPPPVIVPENSSRPPLALRELMNPAPLPSLNSNRKLSNDFSPPIQAGDEPEEIIAFDQNLGHKITPPIKYARTKCVPGDGTSTRTRKVVRMRRSRSLARYHALEEREDDDQFAKAEDGDVGPWSFVHHVLQDPVAHQERITCAEAAFFSKLNELGLFEEGYASQSQIEIRYSFPMSTGRQELIRRDFQQLLAIASGIYETLTTLKNVKDPELSYSIIVQDRGRHDVCSVVPVCLESISTIMHQFMHIQALASAVENDVQVQCIPDTDSAILGVMEAMGCILNHLGVLNLQETQSEASTLPSSIFLAQSTLGILGIGLLSYISSHIGSLNTTLRKMPTDTESSTSDLHFATIGSASIKFSRRRLACLAGFLGGEVNMFVTTMGRDPQGNDIKGSLYAVSTSLADFDDLWGPVQITYSDGSFMASSIITLGGIIEAPKLPIESNRPAATAQEILCHWTRWGSSSPDSVSFDPKKTLLLGMTGPLFRINPRCDKTKQTIYRNWAVAGLGTAEPSKRKSGNTTTLGFNIPYVGTISRSRHIQVVPGANIKNAMIVWHLNKFQGFNEQLSPIYNYIDQVVGLEVSKCTGNAQRLSLWDILRLPEMIKHIEEMNQPVYKNWKRFPSWASLRNSRLMTQIESLSMENVVANIIARLISTGVDDRGVLSALLIETNELRRWQPDWACMLKDGQNTATFAVISSRCIVYDAGRRCCNMLLTVPHAKPAMLTRVQIEASVSIDGLKVLPHQFVGPSIPITDAPKLLSDMRNLGQTSSSDGSLRCQVSEHILGANSDKCGSVDTDELPGINELCNSALPRTTRVQEQAIPEVVRSIAEIQNVSRNKAKSLTEELQRISKTRFPKLRLDGTQGLPKLSDREPNHPSTGMHRMQRDLMPPMESTLLYNLLQNEVIKYKKWVLEDDQGQLEFCQKDQEGLVLFDVKVNWHDRPIEMKWNRKFHALDPSQLLAPLDGFYNKGDIWAKEMSSKISKCFTTQPKVAVTYKFREARILNDVSATHAIKWVCVIHQSHAAV